MKHPQDSYIFYKRKSSDSEDKQILSLDSQDRVIKETISGFDTFKIIANYQESMSAKAPGRPKFNQMCEKLEAGEAKYIICWQLNRLARNPVDGGRIIWLVQNYGIKIITPSKTYDTNDILLMYVEFAMSNQFINDLKKSTQRGMDDKLKAGIAPILAPVGYYNDTLKKQGLRDILPDPDRFYLVRKMWDLFLTGQYSVPKVIKIATNEWGLRQRSGKPISRSKGYELFRGIFYTGQFVYAGKTYQGIHKPMISLDEYDRAQKILGVRGNPRPISHQFALTGLIKCTCGQGVTAHERFRKICSKCHKKYNAQKNEFCPKCHTKAPDNTWYACYYHCTHRSKVKCHQPSIREEDLIGQIDEILASIYLPQEFVDWTLKQLRKQNDEEIQSRSKVDTNLTSALGIVKRRLDVLTTKYLSESNLNGDLITDDEYKTLKTELQDERTGLEEQIKASGMRQDNWIDTAEQVFNFTTHARYWFNNGSKEQKRAIVQALGLNLVLDDKKLQFHLTKPFEVINKGVEILKSSQDMFVPSKTGEFEANMDQSAQNSPLMGGRRGSNPQPLLPQSSALPLSYDHHRRAYYNILE